jgi:hypothetical protein
MKKIVLALLVVTLGTLTTAAQDLTQNWTNKKQDYGTQDAGTVRLVIEGTNTFYYFYSVLATSTSQEPSAFDALSPFLLQVRASQPAGCASDVSDALDAIGTMAQPELDPKSNVYSSISVDSTIKEWKTKVEPKYSAAYTDCTADQKKALDFVKLQAARDLLLPAEGVPSVTVVINAQPCKAYTVVINELYSGRPTSASPLTATFSTTCDRVTFSGGPLFTEVGNPTYVSRPLPNQTGQFLSVENTGQFRATITGLVNINMPWHRDGFLAPFRLGISTGPVFQNSQAGTSSFGWFGGGSVSIFKYAYLTAGEHWGSFPGTPFGFTNGATIPANFGQLTPVPRYTWRFAFALTFRVADLSKVFSGGTGTPTAASNPTSKPAAPVPPSPKAAPTPAPTPSPSPKPGP